MMIVSGLNTIKAQNIATQSTRLKSRVDYNITNATRFMPVRHDSEGVVIKDAVTFAKNVYDSLYATVGNVTLQSATGNGDTTTNPIVSTRLVAVRDVAILPSNHTEITNNAIELLVGGVRTVYIKAAANGTVALRSSGGGLITLGAATTALNATPVLPPKSNTLSWELTKSIKTDADFTASLDYLYFLPAITADRAITLTGTPADGDRMTFINWNTSGNHWNLSGWSFKGTTGSTSTTFDVAGSVDRSFRLIYDGGTSTWLRY
jgi:hypothetical protein